MFGNFGWICAIKGLKVIKSQKKKKKSKWKDHLAAIMKTNPNSKSSIELEIKMVGAKKKQSIFLLLGLSISSLNFYDYFAMNVNLLFMHRLSFLLLSLQEQGKVDIIYIELKNK